MERSVAAYTRTVVRQAERCVIAQLGTHKACDAIALDHLSCKQHCGNNICSDLVFPLHAHARCNVFYMLVQMSTYGDISLL